MRKTIVILAVVLVAAVPLFGQWHSDWRITNNPEYSYTSYYGGWNIAADTNDVHIVWRDYYYPNYQIKHVVFPIGNPPAAGNGTVINTGRGNYPVVAVDGANAHAAWDYSYNMWFREYTGSWGPIRSMGYGWNYPAIADDAAGNTHFAINRYSYGRQVYYRRRNAGSSSFTSPVLVYNPGRYRYAYYPSICVTSDGVIHISFGTNQSGSRYYSLMHAWSTNNGASWNLEQVTSSYTCYYSYATSICYDSDDNLYIAYTSYYSPRHIFVVSGTSGSWSTPEQVSHSTYNYVYYPSICCDTANNVWVCWDDRRGANYELYYNRLDGESGTWDGDAAITSDDGMYSRRGSLAADPHGNVHVCWYDYRHYSEGGRYEIYYNWFTGGVGGGRDLACTRIIKPVGPISTDHPITPSAVIANFGGGVDSGYAMCVITGPGVNYDKGNVEGIVYLEAGEEDAVSFPSWTPPGGAGDKYRVEVTVYLWPEKTTEDDDPSNNTQVEYATIESAVQVDPIAVAKPEEGSVVDSMTPEATFENVGTEAAENFYCYCEIVSLGYHTADYLDSVPVANLDPEETTNITFTQWVCDDDASYIATFFAAIPGSPDRTLLGIEWPVMFQGTPLVGVAESADALRIEVTGPNPFVAGTLVSYAVGYPISTTIRVYDAAGKVVRTLHDGELSGYGSVYWDGTDDAGAELAGGLYFIRIITPGFTKTAKVVLLH